MIKKDKRVGAQVAEPVAITVARDLSAVDRYANRIVGYGTARADWFLANPRNWRTHPLPQKKAIENSLSRVGWVQDVLVNKRTSESWPLGERYVETMVDGHARVISALALGDDTAVPYKCIDLTQDEESFILATLDPISTMAGTDSAQLNQLLRLVTTDDEAIMTLLSGLAERSSIDLSAAEPVDPPDDFTEYGDDIETAFCCPKCGYKWSGRPNADG